jgi:tetratricopeptide (TPR) repeat protein
MWERKVKKKGILVYFVAGTVALTTFLAYLPALQNNFIRSWDDTPYILANPYIRSFDLTFLKWAFSDFYAANWHPLTWISHALDYSFWGLNPLGHHLTNIVLHALNAFLVAILVMRLLDAFKERPILTGQLSFLSDRAALIAAGVTGLLFGLHPIHVESVAWVAERKDLLCGMFFFLAIIAYIRYATDLNRGVVRGSQRFHTSYFITLGFFTLALLSKPMAVSLPVVLLILDWYPFKRIPSPGTGFVFIEKLPFLALSVLSSILTLLAQRAGNAVQSAEFASLATRLVVAGKSLIAYLGKMLLPLNLVPYYPYPQSASLLSLEYLLPVFVVFTITAACLIIAAKHRLCLSAWSYYIATLVPVLGIIQVGGQEMADRYTYIPSLGPFLIVGLAAGLAWENVLRRFGAGVKILALISAVLVFVSLSYLTFEQISVWRSDLDLWTYVIAENPRIPGAYNNRGMIYGNLGQFDKALADLDHAIALDQNNASLFVSHAFICFQLGQAGQGLLDFKRACALGSDFGCQAVRSYQPDGR